MSESIRHECAVAALYDLRADASSPRIPRLLSRLLLDMQNRGQLAAGMTTFAADRGEPLLTRRAVGPVAEVFGLSRKEETDAFCREMAAVAAIGHTRYATTGSDDLRYAQPFERRHGRLWKWFSFAFNGTLSNYPQLRDDLRNAKDYHFALDTDTEVIQHFLAYALRGEERPGLETIMDTLAPKFDGAYCLVFLDAAGRMLVARDPLGIRPLSWAEQDGLFSAASESSALANLGFRNIHALAPGESILVEGGRITLRRFAPAAALARCFFEWVYFSNVASEIDGSSVYESRTRAGRILAEREDIPVDDDTVAVPVPDTAKAAADSFAYHLGIACVEGIFRNRYVGRTFIQSAGVRADAAANKYTPLPSVLSGRRVFLIEDSIVRSTTLRVLINVIRERCNPREIHVRVACPPIVAPCFYGIDMSTLGELFAGGREDMRSETLAEMARTLGVDTLRYLEVDDLAPALGVAEGSLCLGCVTGRYPTLWGQRLMELSRTAQGRVFAAPDAQNLPE